MDRIDDNIKHIVDATSAVTVVATLTTWLPPIAALLSIIWTTLRIWEMITGKSISERRKQKRNETTSN